VTQRLTPLAWVFIGILGLALVVGCTACTLALVDRPTDEPWDPTATPTPVPTNTPAPTAGPSPTPTVWYQDIVTPTVAATEEVTSSDVMTESGTVWWSDQMTEDDEGNLLPPQEVQDAVWEAFIAGLGCYNIADRETIPDASLDELTLQALEHLDHYEGTVARACGGVGSVEDLLERRRERIPLIRLVEFGPRNQVTCNHSPTRCATAVSLEAQGGIWWDEATCTDRGYDTPCILRLDTGEMVDNSPNRFYYAELEYDQGSDQWKIVYLEVSEF
jgi:hypothetical protein